MQIENFTQQPYTFNNFFKLKITLGKFFLIHLMKLVKNWFQNWECTRKKTWLRNNFTHKCTGKILKSVYWQQAGEAAQQCRTLAVLPEDGRSVPSTHSRKFASAYHSSSKRSTVLFWLQYTGTHVDIVTQTNTYVVRIFPWSCQAPHSSVACL